MDEIQESQKLELITVAQAGKQVEFFNLACPIIQASNSAGANGITSTNCLPAAPMGGGSTCIAPFNRLGEQAEVATPACTCSADLMSFQARSSSMSCISRPGCTVMCRAISGNASSWSSTCLRCRTCRAASAGSSKSECCGLLRLAR